MTKPTRRRLSHSFLYPQCVQRWPRRQHGHVKGSHNQGRAWRSHKLWVYNMVSNLGTTEGKLSKYVCSIHAGDMRERAARRGTIIGHIVRDPIFDRSHPIDTPKRVFMRGGWVGGEVGRGGLPGVTYTLQPCG